MKQRKPTTRNQGAWAALSKRAAMFLLLALACWALSGCYMEPDRVVGNDNGLTVNTDGQNFETVITPTPEVTNTPTPQPTDNQQVDWSNWNFGDTAATNPPSNVATVGGQTTLLPTSGTQTGGGSGSVGVTTATPSPTPTKSSQNSSSSDVLKSGSKGSDVKRLQQRLKDLGYYTGSVDGTYGTGTASAVKDFQRAHSLTADGIAGKATQEAVYSAQAKKKTTTSSGGSSGSSSSSGSSGSSSNSYTNGKTDIYLKLGSSGAQVKILQNRLIVLGYLSGTADGAFAETTEAAVIAFQKRNSIYADGIAGPTTLTKLYSSSAKKASSVTANLGALKEGMNGSGVRSLQQQLKTLGYYSGSVDGDYGSGTTAAVIAFQGANGLTQDGVAGKETLNAIYAAINGTGGGGSGGGGSSGTKPEVYGATASSNGYSTISTTSKSSSANVTALQSALSSTGYYSGSLDGKYGSGTSDAVSSYQRAKGLRVTGMAGPTTQRLLYGGTGESGSYSKLKVGSSGSAVKKLQYALYELKYYDGDITGKYDELTESAVMTFQQVNGLDMDGVAGQQTQQRLFSSNAIPCNI